MSKTSKAPQAKTISSGIWVLLSTLILLATLSLWQTLPFFSFDQSGPSPYVFRTVEILLGHLAALLLPMLLLLKFSGPQKHKVLRSNLYAVAGVQILWRWSAVGLAHLDCGNSCVPEITPEKFDYLLILITAITLVITSRLVAKRLGTKD